MTSILNLPSELLDQIVIILRDIFSEPPHGTFYPTIYALRATCRTLHARIPAPSPSPAPSYPVARRHLPAAQRRAADVARLQALQEMASWSCYTTHPACLRSDNLVDDTALSGIDDMTPEKGDEGKTFDYVQATSSSSPPATLANKESWRDHLPPRSMHACMRCMLFKPSSSFALSQVTASHSKPFAVGEAQHARRPRTSHLSDLCKHTCISCYVKLGLYTWKTPVLKYVVDWEGKGEVRTGIVCRRCRKFVDAKPQSRTALSRKCEECSAYRLRSEGENGGGLVPALA